METPAETPYCQRTKIGTCGGVQEAVRVGGGINTRINTNEWEGEKGGDTALRLHHMREELEALLAKVNCAETLNDWIIYGVSDTRVSTIIIQFKKSQK